MNRILLIGNGFDLAHGLATGYKDFINNYWSIFVQNISKDIFKPYEDDFVKFKTNGSPNDAYNSLINRRFCVYNGKTYNYDGIMNLCQELINDSSYNNLKRLIADYNKISDLKLNLLFKNRFFEHISEKNCLNSWFDIENEYYEQLKDYVRTKDIEKTKQLNEDFEQIQNELEKYLTEETKNALYQERKIKNLMYKAFVFKDFTGNVINKLIEEYKADLNKREEEDTEAEKFYDYFKNLRDNEQIEDERQYFEKNMICIKPKNILFLSFNYTDTVSKYLQQYRLINNNTIIHIHGKLNTRDNPIIFGYGDELDDNYLEAEKLNNNEYLKNVKSINYLKTNNYRKLLDFINTDFFQIFILGHSCGNSDRTLLNTLFEHKNCVSIKPFYHKKSDGSDNYEEIIMNISRNFKDKAAFREKVVNKTNCEPLPQKDKSE